MNIQALSDKVMSKRLWAANELLKRYSILSTQNYCFYKIGEQTHHYNTKLCWGRDKQREMTEECMNVISAHGSKPQQRKAARILLEVIAGNKNANAMIEKIAVVDDRNDSLVLRWRRQVIRRDKKCVNCGREENLHAHHISHWADDPINRINVDNGITLCSRCHADEHPEIERFILSRGC